MMRKLMYVREHVVESLLVKLSKARGWLCWKLVSPALRGVPDRIVLKGLRAAVEDYSERFGVSDVAAEHMIRMYLRLCIEFVEVKAPGEKPTPQQERRHAELRALGFTVTVLDSQDAMREWVNRA